MKLSLFAAVCGVSLALATATAPSPDINGCGVCTDIVGAIESRIASQGCSWVTDVEAAAACEAIGFGPEDPLADLCVTIVIAGCPKLLELIEKGVTSPNQLCQDIGYCSVEDVSCKGPGSRCTSGGDCCSGWCNHSWCSGEEPKKEPETQCGSPGTRCSSGSDCCSGWCNHSWCSGEEPKTLRGPVIINPSTLK